MSTMKRAPSRASPPPTLEPWAPRFGDGLHDPLRPLTAMAIDDCEREDKNLEHRVEIELTHYTSSGARFRVTYLGKTLIESARDPEHEACRALLAQGIKGKLVPRQLGGSHEDRHRDGCEVDDHRERRRRTAEGAVQAASRINRAR
jgi:hypothetical protein